MSYLPRPDHDRVSQDVDEIYALTADALKQATTAEERRKAFHTGLLRAFEAGVDAQREALDDYQHDRPTPVPPAPPEPEDDPGTLPPAGPRRQTPAGSWRHPGKGPKKG